MIAEALKYLSSLATDSAAPKELPSDHLMRRLWVGGEVKEFPVEPMPRDHEPACLSDLIALANRFEPDGGGPVVWFDENEVVLVINDAERRDEWATMTMIRSDLFARVVLLRTQKSWMDQKAFVRLLKVELAGTLAPAVLLDRVRKIRIENGQTVSSEVGRSKESMGRAIESKVSGEGEITDEVTLMVPVFKNPGEGERFPVACSVELDPTRMDAFRLMPLPDEVERVTSLAMGSISQRLQGGLDESIHYYLGKP